MGQCGELPEPLMDQIELKSLSPKQDRIQFTAIFRYVIIPSVIHRYITP